MKKFTKSLLILSATLASSLIFAEKIEETKTKTIPVEQIQQLTLNNTNGSIICEGRDQEEIQLEYTIKVRSKNEESAREFLKLVKVDINNTGETLSIKTKLPKTANGSFLGWIFGSKNSASVNYKLYLPKNLATSLNSVNGTINISNLDGKVKLDIVNGKITGKKLKNVDHIKSVNGAIYCEISEVNNDASISTVNGRIKVALPESISCDVKINTVNGGIHCEIPFTESNTKKKKKIIGKINNGGPLIQLSTVNGAASIIKLD